MISKLPPVPDLPLVSRRGLLRSIAGVAGVGSLPTKAVSVAAIAAPIVPSMAESVKVPVVERAVARIPAVPVRTLLQTSPVAGFQYHDGEAVWPTLRVGDRLALVREPRNRYDARAVRLEWAGRKIGYVPAVDNAAISQLLDREFVLDAAITRLQYAHSPWDRVQIAVYLTA